MVESEKNDLFWIIDHDDLGWGPGRLFKDQDKTIIVECINTPGEYYEIEKPAIEVHPSCLEGVPDLLSLGEFNEGALLHTIRTRHSRRQIYTSIGTPILLSINPFQKLKIFTTFIARKYRQYSNLVKSGQAPSEKPEPHLFMVAEDSYQDMFTYNKNQSIIISGESGAGKTEATKIVLKYLAQANTNFVSPVDIDMLDTKNYMGSDNTSIEKQVLDSNPLLEAFGNAKTFKNNNSSRFGKFIRVNFEPTGKIHSATIINYLLEKSRIVYQQGVERNFHIFYQLMASKDFRKSYGLGNMEDYHYMNQSGVYTVQDVDDAEDFQLTIQCMKNIGFTEEEITQVLNIVVAILLLGNLEFDSVAKTGVGDVAQVSPDCKELFVQICELLQVQPDLLAAALTSKKQIIGKDTIVSPISQDDAYNSRDSMAKSIYGKMFNWIVERINQSISQKMNAKVSKNLKFIGLLDIFGFEIFQQNSFEQLCINYANEKLQQHFNHHMFNLEQEEYKNEHIQWSQIQFVDNQTCIDLIESVKQNIPSLFKLLDEECMVKGTDPKLLQKYNNMLSSSKAFKRPNKFGSTEFIVCHYAGEVSYEINGFVEKNKDTVSDFINETLGKSKASLLAQLYQIAVEPAQNKNSQQQFGQVKAPQGGGLKGNTLSNQFRTQLHELMNILKESSPRYIRCIKPNSKFSAIDFDSPDVQKQLRCAGMLEAIRIRKAGYAIRVTQDDFAKRYRAIVDKKKADQIMKLGGNQNKSLCEAIFKEVLSHAQYKKLLDPALKRWQIGVTKVFMKEDVKVSLESAMGLAVLHQARHIQRLWKGFLARKLFRKMTKASKFIKHHMRKFIVRRKFRKFVMHFIHHLKTKLKKLQRMAKFRVRHFKVIKEVTLRIHKKKVEAERRRKLQEELEFKRRQEEQKKQQMEEQKQRQQQQQQQQVDSRRSEAQYAGDLTTDSKDNRQSLVDNFSFQQLTADNTTSQNKINPQQYASSASSSDPSKQRFGQNIQKLEMFLNEYDNDDFQDMQVSLREKINENTELKDEIVKLKDELDVRDKKIKELSIRLDTQRKQQQNKNNSNSLEQLLNNGDISKMDLTFTTMDDHTVRPSQFMLGGTPGNPMLSSSPEWERMIEQKDEELQTIKNKMEIQIVELQGKDGIIESLKDENEQLQEKNKKWISKLNQQIETHNQQISGLTRQIKELQEKNYKLEFEFKEKQLENEKRAYKDQAEEIKRLESQLREKQDNLDELELQKFNLQEKVLKDQNFMQQQQEAFKRQYLELQEKFTTLRTQYDQVEEQMFEKDELSKKYEDDIQNLHDTIKMLQQQLENVGDHMETLDNERMNSTQAISKVKELQREVEKYKHIEQVKKAEVDRYKEQNDKLKAKLKEAENENEELMDKVHSLKNEKAEIERQMMFSESGPNNSKGGDVQSEYEKKKMREKISELERKIDKKRAKAKRLNVENNFYHQTTQLFVTIKKIVEKEKKFCFMMAQESDVLKKKQLMDAINACGEKTKQLDGKLAKILRQAKESQQVSEHLQ